MPATALIEDLEMNHFPFPPTPPSLRTVTPADPDTVRWRKSKGVSLPPASLATLERLLRTVEEHYGARLNNSAGIRVALNVAAREIARTANEAKGIRNEYTAALTPELRRKEIERDVERSQLLHGRHRNGR